MPEGRKIHARSTATAKDAYTRRRGHGHNPATDTATRTRPYPSSVGRVPYVGMNQNTGRKVPRMLPAVDRA